MNADQREVMEFQPHLRGYRLQNFFEQRMVRAAARALVIAKLDQRDLGLLRPSQPPAAFDVDVGRSRSRFWQPGCTAAQNRRRRRGGDHNGQDDDDEGFHGFDMHLIVAQRPFSGNLYKKILQVKMPRDKNARRLRRDRFLVAIWLLQPGTVVARSRFAGARITGRDPQRKEVVRRNCACR